MRDANHNYAAKITVAAPPEACFHAVAQEMEKWWTTTIEGGLKEPGDTVKTIFPPHFGYWMFEATKMHYPERIEVACTMARHESEGQSQGVNREWEGTSIVWDFRKREQGTEIFMEHRGLTPQLQCWDICTDGWNFFFKSSLKAYLNGDPASPHKAA